jgi:hypothetical protein
MDIISGRTCIDHSEHVGIQLINLLREKAQNNNLQDTIEKRMWCLGHSQPRLYS